LKFFNKVSKTLIIKLLLDKITKEKLFYCINKTSNKNLKGGVMDERKSCNEI